jgi:hypothetical protein
MTYVGEDTPYIKLLKPFLLKKKVSTTTPSISPFFTADNPRSGSRPMLGA